MQQRHSLSGAGRKGKVAKYIAQNNQVTVEVVRYSPDHRADGTPGQSGSSGPFHDLPLIYFLCAFSYLGASVMAASVKNEDFYTERSFYKY